MDFTVGYEGGCLEKLPMRRLELFAHVLLGELFCDITCYYIFVITCFSWFKFMFLMMNIAIVTPWCGVYNYCTTSLN